MGNINYIGSVVKILEKPTQTVMDGKNGKIIRTDFRVQLAQVRNIQIVSLVFWGNLGQDVIKNCQLNDHIMIEGYLSLPTKTNDSLVKPQLKKAQITVLKVYSI